jgi:alkylation response protein AidB-like acyl-CoA dehydrogenase
VDFEPTEAQRAIAGLAAEVLCGEDPWKELARSGLLSLAVPADLGGDGYGVQEVAVLLTEIGRRGVYLPALGTLAGGVLPVARWGDQALRRELLPAAAAGELILTAAVREPGGKQTTAIDDGTVSGVKVGVPYAATAGRILVATGSDADGTAGNVVALIDPDGDGVSLTRTPTVTGEPEYTVRLDHAPVLATMDGDLQQFVTAGACALADGALAGALRLTRDHVATRRQFGRPLAEFQAVSQQMADVYIASRTLHLITLSACWQLDNSKKMGGADGDLKTGSADGDLEVATWWVTEEAPRSVLICHHLHGGVGVDISYPLHRFSSLIADLARALGGASVH